ncbi:MAG TPA: metalloregulator ArsR/SmtB family transcription factor [Phycisphaerae bacterium]|nr:metalloregulator ArsR/SmtB family transcription factor [Phycisphaerae bacterium]
MTANETVFRAMSDATRQKLLRVLSDYDLSVSELVEILRMPQSTVSRHLKVLRDAGLLVDRRVGTTVMYAVRPPSDAAVVPGRPPGSQGSLRPMSNGVIGLRDRLLEWVGQAQLDGDVADRLQKVVRRRHAGDRGFFDALAAKWDRLRIDAFGEAFHLEALTALLPTEWTAADIGSGTGYLLPVLSARFRKVIAVDPAPRMIEIARNRPEVRAADNIEFREGTLGSLPLADAEIDLAIVSLVLHHVESPAESLRDLKRTVHPRGGVLIIEQQDHRCAEFYERMGDRWWGFEPAQVSDWLAQAGFREVRAAPLRTARPSDRSRVDAPGLFVVTGRVSAP